MNTKEKILMVAILLFVATLFFPNFPAITTIVSAFFLLTCFLFNPLREKLQLLKERKYLWWMLAFFAWILISLLLSDNKRAGARYLDSRLPLLGIPLTLGLIYVRTTVRDKLLHSIANLITICCAVCLGHAVYNYIQTKESYWLYNDALVSLTHQQSIYIAVLVNISIYIIARSLLSVRNTRPKLLLRIVALLFLVVMAYLLASRTMLIVLVVSSITASGWYIVSKKQYTKAVAMLAVLAALTMVVLFAFPKTLNRFRELANTGFSFQSTAQEAHYNNQNISDSEWNGANFRLAVWQCGWELFKSKPLLGTGLGDKKKDLMDVYAKKNFQFAIRTQRNVHNNYLDILLSMGLAGFILFFTGWVILPGILHIRSRDWLGLLAAATLAIAMIPEVYFDRKLGGMLFCLFTFLFLVDKKKTAGTY